MLRRMTTFKSLTSILTILAMFNVIGCSTKDEPPLRGWQAVHANADGDGWRGPIRRSEATASGDADIYAGKHGVNREEMMVLAIYPRMDTTGMMPPNPIAERPLEKPVTLDAITGYWEIVDRSAHANNARYFLDIRSDGRCKTDFGARFGDAPFDGFDAVDVLSSSSFILTLTGGESYVFSVTRFSGNEMDVLVDGWKEQAVMLTRTQHPSGLKLAERLDGPELE